MSLKNTEQIGHLKIIIIDDFGLRLIRASQEYASHADKGFRIGSVFNRIYKADDFFCQARLSTNIGGDWLNWLYLFKGC